MILPRLSPDGLTPAQREARARLAHRSDPAAERIRRAADVAAHKPTGAESAPEVCNASVSEPADASAPVRTYVGTDESGLQWMVRDFGDVLHVATRRDDWDTWSAPVVLGQTAEVRPCRHYVYAGVCIKCGQRDGAA